MSLAVEADEQEVEMMGDIPEERTVDVVLSDMCEPWEQTSGFFNRTLSDPYHRMMNTSGNNFRDHAGSMVSVVLFSQRALDIVDADTHLRIYVGPLSISASTPSKSAGTSSANFTKALKTRRWRNR